MSLRVWYLYSLEFFFAKFCYFISHKHIRIRIFICNLTFTYMHTHTYIYFRISFISHSLTLVVYFRFRQICKLYRNLNTHLRFNKGRKNSLRLYRAWFLFWRDNVAALGILKVYHIWMNIGYTRTYIHPYKIFFFLTFPYYYYIYWESIPYIRLSFLHIFTNFFYDR